MKSEYEHSHAILKLMCESISPFNLKEEKRVVNVAIFRAIKEGLFDFVSKVLEADPYVIWARDENKRTLFHQAVLYREAKIFGHLYEHFSKDSVMDRKDKSGNNVLHMAGISTPSIQLKRIPDAVLQMQKELQWFKVTPLTLCFSRIFSLLSKLREPGVIIL